MGKLFAWNELDKYGYAKHRDLALLFKAGDYELKSSIEKKTGCVKLSQRNNHPATFRSWLEQVLPRHDHSNLYSQLVEDSEGRLVGGPDVIDYEVGEEDILTQVRPHSGSTARAEALSAALMKTALVAAFALYGYEYMRDPFVCNIRKELLGAGGNDRKITFKTSYPAPAFQEVGQRDFEHLGIVRSTYSIYGIRVFSFLRVEIGQWNVILLWQTRANEAFTHWSGVWQILQRMSYQESLAVPFSAAWQISGRAWPRKPVHEFDSKPEQFRPAKAPTVPTAGTCPFPQ